MKEMIIRLDKEYRLVDEELRKLEEYIKEFPQTSLILTVTGRDADASLVSIEVTDNGRLLASHIYTPPENDAMKKGGRQELYSGETIDGIHRLRAVYYYSAGDKPPRKGEAEITVSVELAKKRFVEFAFQKKGNDFELRPGEFEFIR
ncbi:MAG: hypothetical protein HY883_06010 [Deltaproteobacteria bacterium]|nr:hypothetical protein [Deltaproteobacteria bacterium]